MDEVNLPTQHPIRGWVLRVTAWIMRVAGVIAALGGLMRSRMGGSVTRTPGYHGPPWYIYDLIAIAIMVAGMFLLGFSLVVGRIARLHLARTIPSTADLVPGSYVLYLRPFTQDAQAGRMADHRRSSTPAIEWTLKSGRTFEERLRSTFRRVGPLIAIGRPHEPLPGGSGARRAYLPLDDWKNEVGRLMEGARLIVLGAGSGEGTVWEYAEAIRRVEPHRLVVLITDLVEYERFKSSTVAELEGILYELKARYGEWWDTPILPELPAVKGMVADKYGYVRAIIHFSEGWQPHLRYYVVTKRRYNIFTLNRMIRETWEPVLTGVRGRPPAAGEPPVTRWAAPGGE